MMRHAFEQLGRTAARLAAIMILSACSAMLASVALAGTGQGTIAKVEHGPAYGARVFFTVDGAVTGQPACRSTGNYHFVFDANAVGGKELLASLLLAKTTRQSVVVSGEGQCSLYGGVEDLRWFRLE